MPSQRRRHTMRILPSINTASKLFITGATVGPLVDSLHNQCLLEYDFLPIAVAFPSSAVADAAVSTQHFAICSSWAIPPLLGFAYVVLGGVLPRVFEVLLQQIAGKDQQEESQRSAGSSAAAGDLRTKAFAAVATTALIIKLSEILETTAQQQQLSSEPNHVNFIIMLIAALSQWFALDGTIAALLAATVTSIGGPLSELPFVAHGFWHYLPEAGDYFPLQTVHNLPNVLEWLVLPTGGGSYQDLTLSGITGPCYFAVTMDAIALGRWFDSDDQEDDVKSTI